MIPPRLDTVYCLWYNKESGKFEALKQIMKNEEDKRRLIKSNCKPGGMFYDNGWHFNKDEVERKANELNKKLVEDFNNTIDDHTNYLKVLRCEDCALYWCYPYFVYQNRVKNGNGYYPKKCPRCTYNSR